jgi:hypothetical protein
METELIVERFERRLSDEISALRVDMAKEFAALRLNMAKEFAAFRRWFLKWMFLFSILQVAACSAIVAFLLRTMGNR